MSSVCNEPGNEAATFSVQELEELNQVLERMQPEAGPKDARRGKRYPYAVVQFVAFHDEAETPTRAMFRRVRCRDLSMAGASFFLPNPPAADHCTVALGKPPAMLYVSARVMHSGPCAHARNQQWLIGCQFLRKVTIAS
jgi:hypothetical protein